MSGVSWTSREREEPGGTAKSLGYAHRTRTEGTEVNTISAIEKSLSISRIYQVLRRFAAVLFCAAFLAAPVTSKGAELKTETLRAWDVYVQAANSRMASGQSPFLWVDGEPELSQRARGGEILVSSMGSRIPKPVPSGLIHDWVGASFIPNATIDDVVSAVRDYSNYKNFYAPTVVDSKLLGVNGACDKYSMRVVNKETVAETALEMEYETCYFQIDARRRYSITQTTRVQEIRHFGKPDEQELPPDQGSGYIWRLYSIARYEQRDGGTYVEVEAIALSRDIPVAVRWLVNPIVRRVSRNSMVISLQQTQKAVRSTEAANREVKNPVLAANHSSGVGTSPLKVANNLLPSAKP
jgi:hypothetical protein